MGQGGDEINDSIRKWKADPIFMAEYMRIGSRWDRAEQWFGWTRHIPLVGQLVWVFWSNIVGMGVRDTVIPRWGALTFCFLNDGVKPTLWHTIYSVMHDDQAPYSGIYPSGAPRNRAEAQKIVDKK